MKDFRVAIASPSHLAPIVEILTERRAWLEEKGVRLLPFPVREDWVRQALERGEFFVAESGREFVGVFRLLDSDPAVWPDRADAAFYIHTLTVGRRRHGRGIGGSMLGWIEARAAECGRRFLRLDCFVENPVLCAYYARAGFESCGIREIQVRGTRIAVRRFEKAVRPS